MGCNLSYLLLLITYHIASGCGGLRTDSLQLDSQQLFLPRSEGATTTQKESVLVCQLKGRPGRKTGPFLPHRRRPPSLVLGSLQSQKTVLGRGVRCPAAHDLPGCCSRSSSRQSPVAAAAAGRRPLWRAGRGRPRCSRALAASEAIGSAQSPHAGLQRRPPRIGARAGVCVPPGPY